MIGRRPIFGALATALIASAGGCTTFGHSSDGRLVVVATTTQLGDVARAIGGADADVHQILRPNTDPHEYEPRPADVVAAAHARVAVLNGDGLDRWMGKVVAGSGGHPREVVGARSAVVRLPGEATGAEASRDDPHWWHDPRNVEALAPALARAMAAADPSHRGAYARRSATEVARLRRLDRGLRRCFERVPPAERKLVTDHDAFGYFAHRYAIRVVGAVIPGQTTQAQPSAGAIARLARLVRREHVRVIFPERSVSPKLAEALARRTGARADRELYGDTLGPPGSAGATYLGMERANADAMVRGFTAGRLGCRVPGP